MSRGLHGSPLPGPRPPRYVPGELLLLGPATHVRDLLENSPARATRPQAVDRLPFPAARSLGKRPPFPSTPWADVLKSPDGAELELVRLQVPDLLPRGQAGAGGFAPRSAAALQELAQDLQTISLDRGLPVHVEPHCIVGDPLEWEGDTLFPRVLHVGDDPAEGERRFRTQPSFQAIGLTGPQGERLLPGGADGAGVLVAVMDTAPSRNVSPLPYPPPWLTLHPGSPQPGPAPTVPGRPVPAGSALGRDLSDHGLISVSLIHAVAPAAEIHLYQVLNDAGQGDLFSLLRAIIDFTRRSAGRLAVINLSLGSACGLSATGGALALALLAFADQGGVTCAAAGNTSPPPPKASAIPAAQAPASLPYVIAVAASTRNGHRASYSQRGDIAAPGGEALGAPGPGDPDDPIGLAASHPEAAHSGYVAMDAGTSFATPLVSGASALMLQAISQWPTGLTLERGIDRVVLDLLARSATPPPAGPSHTEALQSDGLGAGTLNLGGAVALSKAYP